LGKDCAEFEQLLKESLASEKLVLIIARRPCVLAAKHIREYEKMTATNSSCSSCTCTQEGSAS
jgi:indolepyruvate ferredoxin oxidoreductase alpha subunit